MKIHQFTPYSLEGDLGKAYNDYCELVPDDSWILLRDEDTMVLTPKHLHIVSEYINKFPDTGIFTCYTNRVHHLNKSVLWEGKPSRNFNLLYWYEQSKKATENKYRFKEIKKVISGYYMLFSKATWEKVKFESGMLGVDNKFSQGVLDLGMSIKLMKSVLCVHYYRGHKSTKNKEHLK